jgi:pilus assembly protein CpaE
MRTKLKLLIAGRAEEPLAQLSARLSERGDLDVQTRHIVNGHADPLYGVKEMPDVLVLHLPNDDGGELSALLERPASMRPPLLVVSADNDAGLMRLAMKAGARDFVAGDAGLPDLDASIDSIRDDLQARPAETGELIALINAKGGSGATFLACNLAHVTAKLSAEATAVVSLDMQFPNLPAYFDMKLRYGLLQALDSAEELDAVALDAYMSVHDSGLKLLAARPEDFRFSYDSAAERANRLFDLFSQQYAHVFVDVPRRFDEMTAQIVSRASKVVLVLQQSLPHVQDATRVVQIMRDQLGVPTERIALVVNRFDKKAEIQLEDIQQALPGVAGYTLPNYFKLVAESINLGVPMLDHARNSELTRALIKLQSHLVSVAGAEAQAGGSKLSSLFRSPLQVFGGN